MIAKYYVAVRPQTNELHAVHKEGCPFLPDDEKRIYLGVFNSVRDAIREGQQHFYNTNSCLFCSEEHKTYGNKPIPYKRVIPAEPQISLSFNHNLLCCLN